MRSSPERLWQFNALVGSALLRLGPNWVAGETQRPFCRAMYALGSDMSTINYRATVHPGNGEEPYETLVPVAASASDLSALARGSPNAPQALHRLADKANIMLITSGLACSICNRGRRATRSESVPSYYPDSEVPPGPLIVDFCFRQICSDPACLSAARICTGETKAALCDSGIPEGEYMPAGPPRDDAPSASSRILGTLYGLKQRYDEAARAKAVAAAEDSFAVPEPPRPAVQKKKKTGGKKGKKKRGGGKENKA